MDMEGTKIAAKVFADMPGEAEKIRLIIFFVQ